MMARARLVAFYDAYLDACNRHDADGILAFVADPVRVGDRLVSAEEYVGAVSAVFTAFPDYRWTVLHVLVEGPWIAVRLRARGTRAGEWYGAPGDGSRVETREHVMYRLVEPEPDVIRIAEIHSTADNLPLVAPRTAAPD